MTDIKYNGICGREIGVFVAHKPDIPVPKPKYSAISIPGRDGSVVHKDGAYEDISIPIEFHFEANGQAWHDREMALQRWLLGEEDPRLFLADEPEWFYKVKLVTLDTVKRSLSTIGKVTVTFLCAPHKYLLRGNLAMNAEQCRYNAWSTCHPVYCLYAGGACRLSVHGGVDINYTGTMYIDSDLMIAYDVNGNNLNASVIGDYENLWFQSGCNGAVMTGNGEILSITPNWRTI